MNLQADAAARQSIYQRLERRNRLVGILRLGVPALGALVLVILVGQIYLSSLSARFGIGRIEVTRDAVTIDTPQYSGILDDGTSYRVWANSAQAALTATDQIALSEATLVMNRPGGIVTEITAHEAMLDSGAETVAIAGVAVVAESTGTTATVVNSVFDYAAQTLAASGRVHIDYADGSSLDGVGMTYDVSQAVWTFSRVSVTLPSTPGSDTP
tara:strand:- start:6124 stop:6762 length:639 start_codon:yes stop_codon:yes gene_type:complete